MAALAGPPASGMLGRRYECEMLDHVLDEARSGRSSVLVLHGAAGVGKTELLHFLMDRASGCRVVRAAGVESEMELPYAGLHQMSASMLDRLTFLPGPQQDALRVCYGLQVGPPPNRFLVGLAVLNLLSEVADETRPLVCLVDDVQWLDRASLQTLVFVARRLLAEPIALVFAVRTDDAEDADTRVELDGLPKLAVNGLPDADAQRLLASVITGPIDARVRDRIIAEARGNPLALLELPRGLPAAEFAGGFGQPDTQPPTSQIEQAFLRRFQSLPPDARRLLLTAAAEPVGEVALLWRAASRLGIDAEAAAPAVDEGLLDLGARVRFRHPLVRSAVYRGASLEERQGVHRALAEVTDPDLDPDRLAWHRARAADAPDEDVAAALESSAERAQSRGGRAAAAAFLEWAASLTPGKARRTERRLAAAQAKHDAGAFDAAVRLLAAAESGPLDEGQHARVDALRAHLAFAVNRGRDAPPLLLKAAKRIESRDIPLARETYLDALSAAFFVGRLDDGVGLLEVAWAARAAPPPSPPPRAADHLLDGLSLLMTEGYPAGVQTLQQALILFRDRDVSRDEELRWLWLAGHAALDVWDDEVWHVLAVRQLELAREAGALAVLPIALNTRIGVHLSAGEFAEAISLLDEAKSVADVTGARLAPYISLAVAAFQGHEAESARLMQDTMEEVTSRGEGVGLTIATWAAAVLYNGLGRFDEALRAAEQACVLPEELRFANRGLVELIEAAARAGDTARAADGLRRLEVSTRACGTDLALGTEARSRAMLSEPEVAERLYLEAIERLGRTRVRTALARARLLYGEWLRGEDRAQDARTQLRAAYDMFAGMGMEAFADRAARGLLAVGEVVRTTPVVNHEILTAQETQIARMARDGGTNVEIGSRLFISPRTVEWHLGNVFFKLGITSRRELHGALPNLSGALPVT